MYRLVDESKAPSRSRWQEMPDFKTYKCSHCGGWLVLRDRIDPPKECGKCHQR